MSIMLRYTMRNTFGIGLLGMHRSGTSALAGSLRHFGVHLGDNLRTPQLGLNDRGYWEHIDILRTHERLLMHLGSSWDDIRPLPAQWWEDLSVSRFRAELTRILQRDFALSPVWAVKDPRMCRLAPMWSQIFQDLGCQFAFIIVFRHPYEVARSLERRDGFRLEKSARLWIENNLAAEKGTRGFPRVFVSFDDLLSNPVATCGHIEEAIEVRFPKRYREAQDALHDFLEPQLRHHLAKNDQGLEKLGRSAELLKKVQAALSTVSYEESEESRNCWDGLHRAYEELMSTTEPEFLSHIADLHERLRQLGQALDRVESSSSWQVTRPLRKVGNIVSRVLP
jgi:hypothetical protein